MNLREWALVAFTLFMQASVGIVLTVVVLQATGGKTVSPARPATFGLPAVVALAAAVLGLLVSLLHLGRPLQAWLALNNLASSWLSREIAMSAVFVVLAGAYAVLALRQPVGAAGPVRYAGWAAAIVGCLVVAAMSRLYMVPAQPAWNHVVTPASFFATSILMGVTVLIALGSGRSGFSIAPSVVRTIAYVAIGLVVVQMTLLPAHLAALPGEPAPALPAITQRAAYALAGVSLLAGVSALIILVRAVRQSPYVALLFTPFVAGGLVVLVAIVTVAGRLLFYAAAVDLRGAVNPPL